MSSQNLTTTPLYQLSPTSKRKYGLTVMSDRMIILGKYLYLKDSEFQRNQEATDTAFLANYLGMGYLSQRSHKKSLLFLIAGTVLEIVKVIIDKLSSLIDKANDSLQWFNCSISLPEWINHTMNILAILCLLFGVILFFSRKKVIEISFTNKRICVPQKSMTQSEYAMLYQSIKTARTTYKP